MVTVGIPPLRRAQGSGFQKKADKARCGQQLIAVFHVHYVRPKMNDIHWQGALWT